MKQLIQWNDLIYQVSLEWNDNRFINTLIYYSFEQWSIQYQSIVIPTLFYSSNILVVLLIQPNFPFWWNPLLSIQMSVQKPCSFKIMDKMVEYNINPVVQSNNKWFHDDNSFFDYWTITIECLFVILHLVISIVSH